jgi:MFS family permease
MSSVILFLLSRGFSVLGLQIFSTALVLSAIRSGADPYFLGKLGLASTMASLSSTLPLGYWVDRIGRKKAWISSQILLSALALSLAVHRSIPNDGLLL